MKYIILLNCTIKTNGCYRRVLPVQLNMQISVAKSPRPCAALQHVRVAVAVAAAITLLSPGVACFGPPSKPNIISILQDDLGNYDTGITNADATPYTPTSLHCPRMASSCRTIVCPTFFKIFLHEYVQYEASASLVTLLQQHVSMSTACQHVSMSTACLYSQQ